MKTKLLLLLTLLMCAACHRDPEPPRARRTVLVYMLAKNSLGTAAYDEDDIAEMLQSPPPDDCRLLVFRTQYGEMPALSEITSDGIVTLKTYPYETVGTDAATLRAVMEDCDRLRPSHGIGLVFWSHSSGWMSAQRKVASRSFGLEQGREMEIDDLAGALEASSTPIDFIFFDSCYMGCVEVARDLRRATRWMAASVAEVPVSGMPYQLTLPSLFRADTAAGLREAIDLTADHYAPRSGSYCPSTLALYDLAQLPGLITAANSILSAGTEPSPLYEPQVFSLSAKYAGAFVDFDAHLEALSPDSAHLQSMRRELQSVVVHERHSPMIWGRLPINRCCGLTINPQLSSL